MFKLRKNITTPLMAIALVGIAVFFFMGREDDSMSTTREHRMSNRIKKNRTSRNGNRTKKTGADSKRAAKEKPAFTKEMFDHMPEADRKLANNIQDALDDEDLEEISALAEEAQKSENPELRQHAVEALGWFGEEALPELTVWMSDPDEDVAQEAMNQWTSALSEVEKAEDRFEIAFAAFRTISDVNNLESIGTEISNAATELIDGAPNEEAASKQRVNVVQLLAEMIVDGPEKNGNAAKEAFEDITGSKWISVDEAEKYLQDPDNYEAPESDDDDD